MKKIIGLAVCLVMMLTFASSAFCADVAKIGVINFKQIMNESSAGKLMQKEIVDKGKEFEEQLNKEKETLDEFIKALKRKKLVLPPDSPELKENEKEAAQKIQAFNTMRQGFANQLKKLEFDLFGKSQKDVTEIAEKIGKERGFLLILEKNTAGIMYHPDHIDLTAEVMKAYNENVAKEKP